MKMMNSRDIKVSYMLFSENDVIDNSVCYLNKMQFPLAMVVFLSHLWRYTDFEILMIFSKVVTITVSVFFFLSGYGVSKSMSEKAHYS